MTEAPLWSVPVRTEEVPEDGRTIVCAADETTRTAIARTAGIVGLSRLEADYHVRRHGPSGLHVTGTVSATVQQTCVVTTEPLTNEIVEKVDLIFAPAAARPAVDSKESPDSEEADPPEPLIDGVVDLGALAVEFLLLGIDPYPRKPGAVFSAPQSSDAEEGPFAALAALKGQPPDKN